MDNEIYLKRKYQYFSLEDKLNSPLELYQAEVHSEWIDYNGHMSESFYLYAFGDASDALFQYVGIDNDYRLAGKSSKGEPLKFTTQILGLDAKKLHIFHQMFHAKNGDLLATTEQMLVHVDMSKGEACEIEPAVENILAKIWACHQKLPTPRQKGRIMAIKK
jgi:acyl-CoA thioesterase FadM